MIARLAVATGLSPRQLLEEEEDMLEALIAHLNDPAGEDRDEEEFFGG